MSSDHNELELPADVVAGLEAQQPKAKPDRPGKKDVLGWAVAFMVNLHGGGAGSLHPVLVEGQMDDTTILSCIGSAMSGGCSCQRYQCEEAAVLGHALLKLTPTQRIFVRKHALRRMKG